MYRDFLGSIDAKPNSISPNFEDRDLYVVGDDDLLILLSANDQHGYGSEPPDSSKLITKGGPGRDKNTRELGKPISPLQISMSFWHYCAALLGDIGTVSGEIKLIAPHTHGLGLRTKAWKHLLWTIYSFLLLTWPIRALEAAPANDPLPISPERFTTISETNYLNELALRGFKLDSQGLLIESLDGATIFGDLNSGASFNPASVIKVATSFTALYKFGPEYHFETAFYADGAINAKTRTLNGDLVLFTTGDPIITAADLTRLARQVVGAGAARIKGNLVVTGPFTYGPYLDTDTALKRLQQTLAKIGIRIAGSVRRGPVRGGRLASHVSPSLRDIVFNQNAHSVNQTAERLGEAMGGSRAVERFLIEEVGVVPAEISISRTSGLDINRITPRATVALLRHLINWLTAHNMQPEDVMPVAGLDPGTLHARFSSMDYRGGVVAKTGTLPSTDGGVSTLAGILYTKERGPILFAIFNSKGSVAAYRRMQDTLLKDLILECGGIAMINASSRRSNN
jgi:D-alanyl-D-alanine carboxypeptidase/D-alanyl-D-alanine-endopeptidase (penicillin-binding protein 4)